MRWIRSSCFPARLMGLALACVGCQEEVKSVSCAPTLEGNPCARWRATLCAFKEECGVEVDDCLNRYAQLSCRSDELATRCADALESASCAVPPTGCDVDVVADLAPAISGCERYTSEICQSAVTCEISTDQAQCLAEADVDCSTALALTHTFDACLLAIADLDCSAWVLPSSCEGVIILR